jgi:hypothetical protein
LFHFVELLDNPVSICFLSFINGIDEVELDGVRISFEEKDIDKIHHVSLKSYWKICLNKGTSFLEGHSVM